MQKTGKRWFVAAALIILLCITLIFSACTGGSDPQSQAYRPESPSVSAQPPQDGSTPDDYEALENVSYVIGKLASRGYYHSENTNTAQATALGFVNVTQSVVGSKDYKNGVLITSTISTSSSSFAPSKAIQKYYGDKVVIVRSATSGDADDWNGLNTQWSDGTPSETLTEEQYGERYGLWATEFSDFVLNEDTILSASDLTRDGENYSITLNLSVSGENDATYYYKKQMVTMGELSSLPEFSYVRLTINFAPDWTVLSCSTEESYTSQKGIISADVYGTSSTTFSYEEADVDVSAYDSYFSKYAGVQHISAQQYVNAGLQSVLDGKGVLSLTAQYADNSLAGYVRLEGEAENISRADISLGGIAFMYEDGELYFNCGGINGKIDLGGQSALSLSAVSADVSGSNVTVSGSLSAAGVDIPVTVVLSQSGEDISLQYIQMAAELSDQTVSVRLAPSSDSVTFASIDKSSAADLTPIAGDILNFMQTGTFSASAKYQSPAEDVQAQALLQLVENEGALSVNADMALTIAQYAADESGVVQQSGSHYVHITFVGGQLYVNYSINAMDAPTGLRLRLAAQDLASAVQSLEPILGLLGDELPVQTMQTAAADDMLAAALAQAQLTAGKDNNGNNTVTLSGITDGTGTLGMSLTAVKNGATAIAAPADGDAYTDVSFISQLAEDISGTAMQVLTGYDISANLNANLFGMPLADVDLSVKVAMDSQMQLSVIIDASVNAGGAIFYGDTQSSIVISGGNVYISRIQTSVYDVVLAGTGEQILETPLTEYRAMTLSHFTDTVGDQLVFALNVNMETIESLMGMFGGMGIAEGEEEVLPADIGAMVPAISGTEEGYSLTLDLGVLLGMDGLGTVTVTIGRGQSGITSIDVNAAIMSGLVGASVNITNNNPGTPVDMSSSQQTVDGTMQALGYADIGPLNAAIAAQGFLTTASAE